MELEVTADSRAEPGAENPAPPDSLALQIVRAGELVYGSGEISPNRGWFSPTYGHKYPALSLGVTLRGMAPLALTSRWRLPQG